MLFFQLKKNFQIYFFHNRCSEVEEFNYKIRLFVSMTKKK